MKKIILFVHQSADLYGSDKVLLALVTGLDQEKFQPIVLLPFTGPLLDKFIEAGIECHVIPITRLSRATLSLKGVLGLPGHLIKSTVAINHVLQGRQVDIVHSNTLAVLSGAIWSRFYRIPHIWHVHEIILRPAMVRKIYAFLLSFFADTIICISNATKSNLLLDNPALNDKIRVVWNGLIRDHVLNSESVRHTRNAYGVKDDEVLLVLVGRINRWKGQHLLVNAVEILWHKGIRNLKILFVGSVVPGQENFLTDLEAAIDKSHAKQCFIIQSFTEDIWTIWDACDIGVIPSTEPEPFGMVALEAMASSKAVIAANHGGLAEIVLTDETGLLVTPNDPIELASAINRLAGDAAIRQNMGRAAYNRYASDFTLTKYVKNITQIYDEL
ncbi:glycosyltransferase family 4 protein [Methylomonas sp. AM2-LC]|uniref:glycosyltransferase family 4 protein n=1 Tax=Methylomonas sp. AM2-LC TaxID=3153301 RepID=UPI0032656E1E